MRQCVEHIVPPEQSTFSVQQCDRKTGGWGEEEDTLFLNNRSLRGLGEICESELHEVSHNHANCKKIYNITFLG